MFTVVIPINSYDKNLEANIRLLAQSNYVKQILLVDWKGKNIKVKTKISKVKNLLIKQKKLDAVSTAIEDFSNQPHIIVLNQDIMVTQKFIAKIVTHYAKGHLYTFKVNILIQNNTAVIPDNRTGVRMKPEMYYILAVAFTKKDAQQIDFMRDGSLVDFAYRMVEMKFKLKHLPQVLCHTVAQHFKEASEISKERTKTVKPLVDKKPKIVSTAAISTELEEKNMKKFGEPDLDRKCSIIIPFMYKGDRWPIFEASIKCLYEHTKDYPNIEIIIHETDKKPKIPKWFIQKYELIYSFNKWELPFHRSWALNVPAKHIAHGDMLCFFDADLIIDKQWVDYLLSCDPDGYFLGWEVIKYLTMANTTRYIKKGIIKTDRIRFINQICEKRLFDIGCGGINIIPRQMFFDIKGWPEDYKGLGYGAEDNSMNYKILSLGYEIGYFPSLVFHLFHDHNTSSSNSRFPIKSKHKRFTKEEWMEDLENVDDNWGEPVE